MTVTVADVVEASAEFATLDEDLIQKYLDERAPLYISTEAFSARADYALLLVTLHLLTLHMRAKSAGAPGTGGGSVTGAVRWVQQGVIQKGLGPASATAGKQATPGTNAWWESTSWGQEFVTLRSLVFGCRSLA